MKVENKGGSASDDESGDENLPLASFFGPAAGGSAEGNRVLVEPAANSQALSVAFKKPGRGGAAARRVWSDYGRPLEGTVDDDAILEHLCKTVGCRLIKLQVLYLRSRDGAWVGHFACENRKHGCNFQARTPKICVLRRWEGSQRRAPPRKPKRQKSISQGRKPRLGGLREKYLLKYACIRANHERMLL